MNASAPKRQKAGAGFSESANIHGPAAPSEARPLRVVPRVSRKQPARGKQATRLAELARHLLEAQDNDYERIARRLHDDLGQRVAAISILLSTLKRRLPPGDFEILEQVDRALQKVVDLGGSLREVSRGFHSSILEHAGIEVALRAYCSEISSRPGVQISFQSSGDFKDVPPHVARGLYRIAEESLKHVAAASVRLSRVDGHLHFSIQSRAVFSLPPIELEIIRQRGNTVGATVRLKASRLTVSIPRMC
jgi:signal transduction histidine kinase